MEEIKSLNLHKPAQTEKTGELVGSALSAGGKPAPVGLSATFWREGSALKCELISIDAQRKVLARKPVDAAAHPIVAKCFAFFARLLQ
jgi:hypothetical protein